MVFATLGLVEKPKPIDSECESNDATNITLGLLAAGEHPAKALEVVKGPFDRVALLALRLVVLSGVEIFCLGGMTTMKPLERAYQRNTEAVACRKTETYTRHCQ